MVDRLVKVRLVFGIGTVGDHDAHGDGDGIEQLPHGIHQDGQEFTECQVLEIGDGINQEALPACAGDSRGGIGVAQRQGIDGNDDDEQEEDRHEDLRIPLDALLHPAINDEACRQDKDQEPADRFPLARNEARKILAPCSGRPAAGKEGPEVFQHPAANDAVVRQDQHRHQAGQHPDPAEAAVHFGRRRQRALARAAPQRDFRRQQRVPEGRHQQQVADQKQAAAVTGSQEREAPDIPQADGTACRGHDKS